MADPVARGSLPAPGPHGGNPLGAPGDSSWTTGHCWAARFRVRAGQSLLRVGRNPWVSRLVRVETVRRRLELAGIDMSLDIVVGAEAFLAICGGLGTLGLGLLVTPAFVLSPIAPLASARGFELALARRARRRQEQMGAAVPDLVELLVVTTDAGLSP